MDAPRPGRFDYFSQPRNVTRWFIYAGKADRSSVFRSSIIIGLSEPLSTERTSILYRIKVLPALFLVFVVFFYLTDKPAGANWLTDERVGEVLRERRLDDRSLIRHSAVQDRHNNITTSKQLTRPWAVHNW
jgi:hypothetical protein